MRGKIVWGRKVRLIVTVLLVFGFVAAREARAQQTDLTTVAAKVAQELEAKKVKRVAVFDFAGPGDDLTALGQKLADEFSGALAKSGGKLQIEDRSKIAANIKKFDYQLSDLRDPNFGDALLSYLGVNVAIVGIISRQGDEFTLSVRCTHAGKNGANFIEVEHFSFAASEDTAKLAATVVERGEAVAEKAAVKTAPNAAANRSYPACIDCPGARFTNLAAELNLRAATVVLIGVVTPEGRLTDIKVTKRAPAGLTESAIDAVQKWKFRPANGPDGKPTAVRQVIEVTFHLYK